MRGAQTRVGYCWKQPHRVSGLFRQSSQDRKDAKTSDMQSD
jgi:hypothetical protein